MNLDRLIKYTVGITIGLVLIAGLIYPIVDSASYSVRSVTTQESYGYLADTHMNHEYTFTGGTIYDKGEALGTGTANIVSDCFKVIFYGGAARLIDKSAGSVNTLNSLTINPDGTYSYNGTLSSNTLEWFIGPAKEGDYVYNYGSLNVDSKSIIYAVSNSNISDGSTQVGNTQYIAVGVGTYDDLKISGYVLESSEYVPLSGDLTLAYTENEDKSYTISNTGGAISIGDYSNENNTTALFAPKEYKIITESDSAYISLISIIPLLAIITLIVFAAGMIYRQR